jgi:hypothetical protein
MKEVIRSGSQDRRDFGAFKPVEELGSGCFGEMIGESADSANQRLSRLGECAADQPGQNGTPLYSRSHHAQNSVKSKVERPEAV